MARFLSYLFVTACLAFVACAALAHEAPTSTGQPTVAKAHAKVVTVAVREAGGKMLFSPDTFDIAKDETVRFVVHNNGALPHEFVIGTKEANAKHAKMMVEMPEMNHHDANAISLRPGATQTLTWRFAKSGTFEFACLLPGHYEAGMHGAVNVR